MAGNDFIENYLDYSRQQVSPTIYHQWCALAILGAAMERRCWLTRGYKTLRVYPGQLMVVLVGKSALTKKTTAVNMAADLLSHLPAWAHMRLPIKTSPQHLLKILSREGEDGVALGYPDDHPTLKGRRVNSSGFVVAGELSVFFSADAFNETMTATICELNDAPIGKRVVEFQSWKKELWNPLIGLIGGITPQGIAHELPKHARTAGFFGRILWVHAAGTDRRNSLTNLIEENKPLEAQLRGTLTSIAQMYGPFQFTDKGKAWFDEWYHDTHCPRLDRMESTGLIDGTGYWGRKDAHLLRVAMAASASRSGGRDRELRRVDLVRAEGFLAELEHGYDAAMAEIGISHDRVDENQRVLRFIDQRGDRYRGGWVPNHDVVRFTNGFGMKRYDREDCLTRLEAAGDLEHQWVGQERGWRRVWTQGGLIKRATEEYDRDRGRGTASNVVPLRRKRGEG